VNIFVRAYGSHLMGMGHLYRMQKLINKIKSYNETIHITFFTRKFEESINIYKKIKYDELIEIDPYLSVEEEKNLLKKILKENIFDVCINDQLNTNINLAKILTGSTKKSITFDDLGNGNYLFDHIINILYPSNKNLDNEITSFDYLIINDYSKIKKQIFFKEKVNTIFINQGAADTWGAIPDIINDLNKLEGNIIIKVLLGPSYKHYNELSSVLKYNKKQIEIYNFTNNIIELVKDCDLAILGGGNTLFEVLSLGIPVIASTREKKELVTIERLLKNNLIYAEKKLYEKGLEKLVRDVIYDIKGRKEKFYKNRKIFDYKGLEKIVKLIL
jgi:UDP-2,4-diacetamido-2,4,6-trideoxy-beta-L-altropyranose hydrolase